MSGAILGTAFGAMQIVYAAYRDIKSNKENCTALVQRAEIVVEELKLLAGRQTQEEDTMTERVGTLLSAFENMAQVIRQIGHKNWLRALLDADRDAIQVEHCHRCLTDLMLLFNIEQGLDQWNLQQENEHARKRDHHDLLQVTQSVQSELATQGLLIGEVLDMVRTLSQSPTLNAPAPSASPISMTSHTYHRTGSPNLSKFQPITRRDTVEVGVREDSNMATPKSQRRVSWLDKLGLQRISTAQISIPGVGPTYSVKTQGISGSKAARTKGPLELVLGIPKHKSENLKVAARDLSDGQSSSERGRKRTPRQPCFFRSKATLPGVQPVHMLGIRPSSMPPSISPCSLKYIEVRYYSGNMTSGVLLSEAFNCLGKTTIRELRLASSHPVHPCKLSRLNEGNFVMEIPKGIHPADVLKVAPWADSQGPFSIVWVVGSSETHLEPVKVSVTGVLHFDWALVPCTTNTLVQDVASIIGKLTNQEIIGCFRREGRQTRRMDHNQLLRDCNIGRGMYIEVEIAL